MSQLVCENISKKYKNKEVLHDVDLTIEQGKIYGLIGRNGAGKTTLLSILTAQNPPTEGQVFLDGESGVSAHGPHLLSELGRGHGKAAGGAV
jgi:ABC-2 type transport system ATP-binding protein